MAFKKSTLAKTGALSPDAYWRIQSFSFRRLEQIAVLEVYGYHDQQSAADGRSPVDIKSFTFDGAPLNAILNNPVTVNESQNVSPLTPYNLILRRSYIRLKQTADFEDAEDVP